MQGYLLGVLRKKQLMALFFSLMLLNLIKSSISDFVFAILAYMQGGLRKKQLITSFLKHFMKNKKNTMCVIFKFIIQN